MTRTLLLAMALGIGLAVPAMAKDVAVEAPDAKAVAGPASKGNLFTEEQARVHLAHLGFTSISVLEKDQDGVWRGSATKNGQVRAVAVDIKGTAVPN